MRAEGVLCSASPWVHLPFWIHMSDTSADCCLVNRQEMRRCGGPDSPRSFGSIEGADKVSDVGSERNECIRRESRLVKRLEKTS